MKRHSLNVAVKYLIGFSLALIAVSNCFNVLSSSSFFVASPSSDVSRAEAAKPDSRKLSAPSSVSDKLDGGSSLFNSLLNSPGKRSTSPWAGLRPAALASPFATTLTATKTDNISTPVNPGDTIMYTITITNTGAMDATSVQLMDTLDANVTLVAGSVKVAPIAVNDTYNTIGNVNISVPAPGLLGNDLNPNGSGTLSITAFDATSTGGGTVTVNTTDGSFTYNPAAGFTGPDTFTYTLGNSATPGKTDTATVTITVTGKIWFVNSAAGVNGDGRLNTPFNILTGAGSADSVDGSNDVIFLYTSGTNYTGGITLNSGEKVIGQGASQSILTITGFLAPSGNNLLPGTNNPTDPMITTAGADGITLASGNGLFGFTVGDTVTGDDISGNMFGTLTVMDVSCKGTGEALNLGVGTIMSGSTFDLLESTGGGTQGVHLSLVGGGFTTPTTNIVNPTGNGVDVQNSPAGTAFSFGATTVNKGASAGTGVNLVSNSGTFSFSSLAVTTSNGTGVSALSSGTVNVTTGSITSTGGPALESNPTMLGMTFTSVSSTNSTSTGISLTSASGSLSIGTTTITNPSGIGISETSSSATVSYGTTSVTSSGGTGVVLGGSGVGNTGTITFGDLDISPDANQRALLATDNTMTITTTSGTISTSNATAAVEITRTSPNTTPLMIVLDSVSANGGTKGIAFNGTSGSFTVNGTGSTDGTGGTIQNTTNRGAEFKRATNITLKNMNFTSAGTTDLDADNSGLSTGDNLATNAAIHLENVTTTTLDNLNLTGTMAEQGINGNSVSTFTLSSSSITNAGNGADEDNIHFYNMSGTSAITNTVLTHTSGGGDDNLNLQTQSGTLNLTISGGSATGIGGGVNQLGSGYLFAIRGTSNATITFSSATSSTNFSGGIVADAFDTATMNLTVSNSTSSGNNDQLSVSAGDSSNVNLSATGNTLSSVAAADFVVISLLGSAFDTGFVFDAVINSNNITVANGLTADGIIAFNAGGGAMNVAITGNTIDYAGTQRAIIFQAGQDGNGANNLTITGNTIDIELDGAGNAVAGILAQTAITGPGNTSSLCADIGGAGALSNTFTHSLGGVLAAGDIRVRQRNDGTMRLPLYAGGATDTAAVIAYLNGRNAEVSPSTATADSTGFAGGAACTQPNLMSLVIAAAAPTPAVDREGIMRVTDNSPVRPDEREAHTLTQGELDWMVQAALARWREMNISAEDMARLQGVTFEVADLPGDQIAKRKSTGIQIDEKAAGYGWYFDEFPMEDGEFQVLVPDWELQTLETSPAYRKMDLLTVVMRELAQVFMQGKDKLPKTMRDNLRPLTEWALSPSVRRLPLDQWKVTRSTSRLSPTTGQPADSRVASNTTSQQNTGSTSSQPKAEFSTSLLRVKPAVFNPNTDLMPGNYGRSARRMSYALGGSTSSPRPAAAAKPMFADMVNLMLGTLPPGEKFVIMFNATVNAANTFPPGTSQVCNQGFVSATGIPSFGTNDPDTVAANDPTCTTLNVADVSVTKSAGASPVCSTSNITFTINYNNAGPAAALNALVSDAMPVGTSLVSVTTPATWTRSDLVPVGGNGTITFTKASSPNGEMVTFTIVVSIDGSVADGAVIQDTATVSSTTPDPNNANNTSAATSTTVKKPPTTATVGGAQTICALGTTGSLGGNTPVIGTGTWTVQSGGTGTFNPNATTPGATFTHLTGVGPVVVRWTISNPPCPDSFAEVTITVRAQPTATVGGPQTICALGTTASLGGNTPTPPATGMWSIVTAGVAGTFNPGATTPGATFTHTSGAIGSTATLRWTVSNAPCTDATADVLVTIKSQPTATVGGPQTICGGGTTAGLGGNTPAAGATGTWSIVTPGITGTFNPNANAPNATFTHSTGATSPFTLTWTVSNAPCTSATADVMITLLPAPVATAGGAQTICELGTTASLGGNTPAMGETGTWSIVTAGVVGTFNPNATTPGATFTHTSGGVASTITLRWTVTNPTCGQSATADVLITIKQQPTATVGGAQTICALGTTAGLGGNTPAGGAVGTWTIVTGGATGTFNPNANAPNATFTHLTGMGMITLRWTVTNAPCSSASADVVITITQPPTTATVGGAQTICALGTTGSLGGNTPTTGTGMWTVQSGGTGTFNPNATTPGATFTHLTGTGPIVVRWTISNPPCPNSFAEVTITVSQPPTTATVGGAQTICALGTTASLGGNTPTSGTGMWTVQSGGTGTFNPNASTPGATFTHLTGTGPIVVRWTISNPPCPASFAEVTITITQSPTAATVGGAQTICALGTTAGLGGNSPSSGTGTWTVQSGGTGTFNPNANTPGATFTHLTGTGPIVLRWTIANPPCPNSFAEVTITITQPPTTATVGGAQTICNGSTTTGLGGNTPSSGTGLWTIVTGGATGTFNPNASTPNATFTPTSGPGTIVVRWTISNPPCPASFAEVTITVKQQPTATAGSNQTICANSTTAGLGGNTPTGGATGMWTIVTGGASGTFNPNASTPNATFSHTGGTGPITVRWTVSNAPCPDATANVVITITQPPTTATVGPNQTITPGGTTAGLGGNTKTSGTGMWSIVTAGFTGTFNPNATTPNATWTHLTGSGQVVLRWTISNPPCPSSQADVTIQIGVPPTITCPASPVMANAASGQCQATVSFTVTATGIPSPTVMCTPSSGSTFPVGNTTVNCTATNGVAPNAMCSFVVQVKDTQPPVITCPPNVTAVTPNIGGSGAVVTYPNPTVSDNCPGVTSACNPPSGSTFPVGCTTVTCTATDTSGNTATCSFQVCVFNVCLQDNSNSNNRILINTMTGDYRICCNGVTYTGKGKITAQGSTFTLEHNALDRRVRASVTGSAHSGTASLQSPPGTLRCNITDSNTSNNTTCTSCT